MPTRRGKASRAQAQPDAPSALIQLGRSGLSHHGGVLDSEEWLRDLQRNRVKIYAEMRDNSAIIGTIKYAIESLVLGAPWSFEPADDSDAAANLAAWYTDQIEGMASSFQHVMVEIMSMLDFGWAALEPVYTLSGGRYTWRDIQLRAQESLLAWEFDELDNVVALKQQPPPRYETRTIPRDRFALFRHRPHKNNPEGRSLYRNCYIAYKFAKTLSELEAIGIERDATGMPVQEMPVEYISAMNNVADTGNLHNTAIALRDNVTKIRRGEREGLVTVSELDTDGKPTGFKLRPFMSGGGRQFNTGLVIERWEKRIAMAPLAEFVFVGMSREGALSVASEKTSTFANAVAATLRNIEQTFNTELVGRLADLNRDPVDIRPRLRFGDIERRGLSEVATALAPLIQAQAITPDAELEAELRTMGGLPAKAEDETTTQTGDTVDPVQVRLRNQAIAEVIRATAAKQIPRESGVQQLVILYGIDEGAAQRLLANSGLDFEPASVGPDPSVGGMVVPGV